MSERFDYFVVFAEMRTGSNFLEANLNSLHGVECHGEAFNPNFLGHPKTDQLLGVTLQDREADPVGLLNAIASAKGMNGFRFFHDHDARVLSQILGDPRCAKIVLTRNPAESYVSWKIAQSTGQWMLTDLKGRKADKAEFDADEFATHITDLQNFQLTLQEHLQTTGQTAFYVAYEDLQKLDVINGLAAFLDVPDRLEKLDKRLKVQNPSALSDKVTNFDDMQAALAGIDRYNLTRTPNFEPRRSAAVPKHIAGRDLPLLFMPVPGGPTVAIEAWLADAQGGDEDTLLRNLTQKDLRKWKKQHGKHRSFTVLRHPLARAHHVFCTKILDISTDSFPQLRKTLIRAYNLKLPETAPDAAWSRDEHTTAFAAFLKFLKGNLTGQTSIRVDANWASQTETLQGFGRFVLPDHVFREDEIAQDLPRLAASFNDTVIAAPAKSAPDHPHALDEIYAPRLEKLCQGAYPRDYMMFGFGPWSQAAG